MSVPTYYEEDKEARQMAATLFEKLDTDKSGYLSTRELEKARTQLLSKIDASGDAFWDSVDNMGTFADANQDGEVELSEWHEFISSLYQIMGRRKFMGVLQRWVGKSSTSFNPPSSKKSSTTARRARLAQPKVVEAKSSGATTLNPPTEDTSGQDNLTPLSTDSSMQKLASEKKEEEDAAVRIQSILRGNKTRKSMSGKLSKSKTFSRAGNPSPGTDDLLSELWEILTQRDGRLRLNLDVEEVVEFFDACKKSGLNMDLADYVPMHFEDQEVEPEDISPGECARLCLLLCKSHELSMESAREALIPIKRESRKVLVLAEVIERYIDEDANINFAHFKRLLPLLANLMCIDLQYFIYHMAWRISGKFQMPDTLAALMYHRCLYKSGQRAVEAQWSGGAGPLPDLQALDRKFSLKDFSLLLYNGGMVRQKGGKSGVNYIDISKIFYNATTIVDKVSQAAKGTPRDRTDALMGRTEFQVLMDQLWRYESIQAEFASPLQMCVTLLQRAQDVNLIDPDVVAANALEEATTHAAAQRHTCFKP